MKKVPLAIVVLLVVIAQTFSIALESPVEAASGGSGGTWTNAGGSNLQVRTDYLTLTLPPGWSIMESTDNNGYFTYTNISDNYQGLSEFLLFNSDSDLMYIFSVLYVNTGFEPNCDQIYRFADSSETEIADYLSFCQDMGTPPESIITNDFSTTTYAADTVLGVPVRRIGQQLYFDSSPDTPSFDPIENITSLKEYPVRLYDLTTSGYSNMYFSWLYQGATYSDADLSLLDNVLNSITANPLPLHRFWSNSKRGHFYTMAADERLYVSRGDYGDWQYEGQSYRVWTPDNCNDRSSVYRFWSNSKKGHFYTISATERDAVRSGMYGDWQYEGAVFCAQTVMQADDDSVPVYRFWSNSKQHHFYTVSESEKTAIQTGMYGDWVYEGIAYYAKPISSI